MKDLLKKIIICLLPSILNFFVIMLNYNCINIYNNLDKPLLSLPIMIILIVWCIFYIAIGISLYRVCLVDNNKDNYYFNYIIQLLLNYFGMFLFFGFRLYGLTFIVTIASMIFVIITTIKSFKKDRVSGIIMTIYSLWYMYNIYIVCFIWMRNEM